MKLFNKTVCLNIDKSLDSPKGTENDRLLKERLRSVDTHKSNNSYRILVVDDEEDIVFTVKTILTQAGFYVDAFTNPSVAFELFRPERYELIILDIRMPNLNGFELYMKLLEQDSSIKVLFLTALNEFSMYTKYKNNVSPMLGKRYYLQKPVEFSRLLQRVEDMLRL